MAHDQTNTVQLPHNNQQENPAKKVASNLQNRLQQPSVAQADPADKIILDAKKELEGMTHIAFSIV
jgi:hypothetical protein